MIGQGRVLLILVFLVKVLAAGPVPASDEGRIKMLERWLAEGQRGKVYARAAELLDERGFKLVPEALLIAAKSAPSISAALEHIDTILGKYPNSSIVPAAWFQRGLLHYYREEYDRAERDFEQALASNPRDLFLINEESLFRLAMCAIARKEYDKAGQSLMRLQSEYPGGTFYSESLLSLADIGFRQRDYVRARESYHSFLVLYPQSRWLPWVYLQLARCAERIGKRDEALEMKQFLVKNFPNAIEAYAATGKEHKVRVTEGQDDQDQSFPTASVSAGEIKTPEPSQATLKPSNTGEFVIQLGSFRDRSRAERLLDDLRFQGLEPFIEDVRVRGDSYHRVRIGYFPDRESAERFKTTKNLSGWVFRR